MRLMKTKIVAVLMSMAVLAGCASGGVQHPATPGLSVEGQVAVAGRQVIAAVASAADGIDQLIVQQVLTRDQGVAVLQRLRIVGTESQRLADALLIIDQATDAAAKQNAVRMAGEIIKGIQRGVTQAIVPVGTEDGRAKVAALLSVIGDALVAVSLIIPGSPAAAMPAPTTTAWAVAFRPAFV